MKRTLHLFALLLCFAGHSQIVNIPDPVFKAGLTGVASNTYSIAAHDINGNYITIDANGNGEIETSEALAVWDLSLNFYNVTITSLQGIEAFNNVRTLNCTFFSTLSGGLDVTSLTNLKELNCMGSYITSLNVSGLMHLETLSCMDCNLTSLNVSGLTALKHLDCKNNYNSIDVTWLTSLNVTGCTALEDLDCSFNKITTLDVSGLTNLKNLSCWQNEITTLDISGLSNLEYLQCSNNHITTPLDFSAINSIQQIRCAGNAIPSINVANRPNLQYFYCGENQLTELELGNMPSLILFNCMTGQLTNIDFSGCPVLEDFNMIDNHITYINLKNGNAYMSSFVTMSDDVDEIYFCVDEGEEAFINSHLADFGLTSENLQMSTYCSFTPGGDYNTIAGTLKLDSNNDGCDSADIALPFTSVLINDGTTTGISYTSGGSYNFYTQAGTFTLTPQFENNYFTASTETVTFADNNNNTATQNFCVTANGIHNDAEVIIVPILGAQPGFDADYKIVYKNKGNQTLSGDIVFTYDDAVMDYVSASPVETTTATGSLTWDYTNLLPFESREIYVTLNVNSPMETPAVNINDVLTFTAAITPATGDETPADNTFDFSQGVVGSFDPNDITCLEGNAVSPDKIGEYLHYNINFENTGTAPATFVVVKDIIDISKFDISSLQILNASHAIETRVTGNKVEFYFDNINLAADGGKGNVSFKIKSLNSLAVNSSVMQKADIYFDYNWPILTNEATTTFGVLNVGGFTKDATIKVYPNPVKNIVSINAESAIRSVQLYDVQGRLLEAASANDITATLDVSSRANGIYFIKVATDKGVKVEKVVKQ